MLTNKQKTYKINTLGRMIKEIKGQFFTVTFVKKDGSKRTINLETILELKTQRQVMKFAEA